MLLTQEKIRQLTVGAMAVMEEENGLRFAKCTADQLEAWKEALPWIYANAVGSTGVRMDFTTDSDFVTFTVAEYGKYEVKLNGLLFKQFLFQAEQGEKINSFTIQLKKGVNRVTMSLPSHGNGGVISSVEVADGAICERHRFDSKLLFLGDSITQGWNSHYDSMSYAYLVSDGLNAESVIQGIGGAIFAPSTVLPMDFEPDTVIVAYGTNDWGYYQDYNTYRTAVHDTLAKVSDLYGKASIYVISPIWREDIGVRVTGIGDFAACCGVVREMAALFGMTLIEGDDMIPPSMDYMADSVHPNDLGFAVYAANVLKAMKK